MESDGEEQSGTHFTMLNTIKHVSERKTPFLVKISDGCREHPYCFVNLAPVSIDLQADRVQMQMAMAARVA